MCTFCELRISKLSSHHHNQAWKLHLGIQWCCSMTFLHEWSIWAVVSEISNKKSFISSINTSLCLMPAYCRFTYMRPHYENFCHMHVRQWYSAQFMHGISALSSNQNIVYIIVKTRMASKVSRSCKWFNISLVFVLILSTTRWDSL